MWTDLYGELNFAVHLGGDLGFAQLGLSETLRRVSDKTGQRFCQLRIRLISYHYHVKEKIVGV